MKIDNLSPAYLETVLKAYCQSQSPPDEILGLSILAHLKTSEERSFGLHDWLLSIVQKELTNIRDQFGTPDHITFDTFLKATENALRFDFGQGNKHLEAWSALYYRHLTPLSIAVDDAANYANVTPRQFRRRVKLGLNYLASIIKRTELAARKQENNVNLKRYLPLPEYQHLFGVDKHINQIASLLKKNQGNNFISVEGIGGIGKTAVTRSVANCLSEDSDLDFIAWISARQQWLSPKGVLVSESEPVRSLDDIVIRLTQQLGQEQLAGLSTSEKLLRLHKMLEETSGLIVIDNLETLSELKTILPALAPLANKNTRFLLTSRHTVRHFPYVQAYVLPELTQTDSKSLIASELKRLGSSLNIYDEHIQMIYLKTGGLPLALKLIAAQMASIPLTKILQDLEEVQFKSTEEMYSFIYCRTWLQLDDEARSLLLSMLLISPDGEDIEWLRMSSDLGEKQFYESLAILNEYSLLETTGTPDDLVYNLHRMTMTFLQTKVLLDWKF